MLRGLRWIVCGAAIAAGSLVAAQDDFDRPPISYSTAPTHDRVARLKEQLEQGKASLERDEEHGYLRALLAALDIDASSQTLVFSQTSLQLRKISPHKPRALYYNDDAYVGWVQDGDVLEVSAVDDQQGVVFYTLDQREDTPQLVRDRGHCLSCHATSRTKSVPGLLVRSVYADAAGRPWFGAGTFTNDHSSPFKDRWGGWYLTGNHGEMRHMANVISTDRRRPENIDRERGANRSDLSDLFDVRPYLTPKSDIVALMVLTHQTQMHNWITRAGFETRKAIHSDEVMNKALERPDDYRSESAKRRISSVAEDLVSYLLFSEEFKLTSPVEGDAAFRERFARDAARDSKGRSLRDFDLQTRLFKYPCSYMIHSSSFKSLPAPVMEEVLSRLSAALGDPAATPHLSDADRTALREILAETVEGFPPS